MLRGPEVAPLVLLVVFRTRFDQRTPAPGWREWSGFRVSGFRFRVSGFRFQVSGFGFRVPGFGFRGSGFRFVRGLRFSGDGFRFRFSGFRLFLGLRLSDDGFTFRVEGLQVVFGLGEDLLDGERLLVRHLHLLAPRLPAHYQPSASTARALLATERRESVKNNTSPTTVSVMLEQAAPP